MKIISNLVLCITGWRVAQLNDAVTFRRGMPDFNIKKRICCKNSDGVSYWLILDLEGSGGGWTCYILYKRKAGQPV